MARPSPATDSSPEFRYLAGQMKSDGAPAWEAAGSNELDRTLIAAIAARNETAFNEICVRYHGRIARFARRITRSSELIAEITNDTLWAIWRCAPSFKGGSRVSTWILGIAYHIGRDGLKRNRRREAHEDSVHDELHSPDEDWLAGPAPWWWPGTADG